jgi:hypothetical protein
VARRRRSGELGSVLRNTRSHTGRTSVLLTSTWFCWQAPRWLTSDGRTAVRRAHGGDQLGLDGGDGW